MTEPHALENLVHAFPGQPPLFRGLSLSVAPGECVAILGPGGSGKTLLLKTLAGLFRPDEGKVRVHGRTAMAFQKGGLFDWLTTEENVLFALKEIENVKGKPAKARAAAALAEVGLEGHGEKPVDALSGGMQKRLGLARALVTEPSLVLFDEPTAGLDPVTARQVNDLLKRMQTKHRSASVVATSDPAQARQLGDRVGFLHDGKLVFDPEHPVLRKFLAGEVE